MGLLPLPVFLIFVTSCVLFVEGQLGCIVTTRNGAIIGAVRNTLNSARSFCAYTGIPYAAPPLLTRRFQAPQPAPAWNTPLNATSQPNWCPQGETPPPGVMMSEDCLYLNVFQPIVQPVPGRSLPVMMWIYGGAFVTGSALPYTPERLLARGDVILVVAQYRLGLLGFLSTGDDASPGNYGLKDQAFAIRWINQNIEAFGGNTSQVTVFGESAGSVSTTYQLLTPLNRGIIHGIIAQSGTALTTWALDRNPLESARLMARRLGCPTTLNAWMVACFRLLDWQRIVEEQGRYARESHANFTYALATMTPVVEPNIPGAFITREPLEIMRTGDIDTNVPIILGANKHDGSAILAGFYLARIGPLQLDRDPEYMRNNFVPDMMRSLFMVREDVGNRAAASSVELAFLSGVNRSSWEACMPGLVDFISVFGFKASIQDMAEVLSRRGSRVYLYSFEHHSNNTLWPPSFSTIPIQSGITHGDDMIYLFNFPSTFTPNDDTFSQTFIDMWLNFGISGDPTSIPSNRYEQWLTYNATQDVYMKLNVTPTVRPDYRSSWRPSGFEWN